MQARNDGGPSEAGALHAGGASLAWTIDGSSLFCSDFEGDPGSFGAVIDAANALAVGRFAAVLVARMHAADTRLGALRAAGFFDDGEPFEGFLTLVRDVR
ncbi:MAG: hypothetical protein NVSMB19_14050 [Vulcanimicrobiaceae bacterium]